MLFFIHIPKTAGTSVRRALEDAAPRRLLPVYNDQPKRTLDHALARAQADSIVFGHFSYGLHEKFGAGPAYATVLRNPVDRVVSWYNYVSSRPNNPKYELTRNASLETIVRDDPPVVLSNFMTSLIAGTRPKGRDDRQTLERAKRNLESFAFVSTQENIAEDLPRLEEQVGVHGLRLGEFNKTKARAIDDAAADAILDINQLDRELYTFAQGLRGPVPA